MVELMGLAYADGQMGENTKVNGNMENSTVEENKLLQVVRRTKVSITKIGSMVMAFSLGQMERSTMGIGSMENSMAWLILLMHKEQ